MYSQLLLVILNARPIPPVARTTAFARPQDEVALLAVVAEGARDSAGIHQQAQDSTFHVHFHALMNAVVLQGANHLEAGAVADMREPGISMAAEVALQNASVLCAIEQRPPGLEFPHAVGRFLGVQFGHAPVVQILAAAHRIGESGRASCLDRQHSPELLLHRLRPSQCAPCRVGTCRPLPP